MKSIITIFVVLGLLYTVPVSANSIIWQRVYSDSGDDGGTSTIQAFNGDYVFCGFGHSGNTKVLRVNRFGEIIWVKYFTGRAYEKIVQTRDSNFVLTGFAQGQSGFNSDAYIIKINQDGNLIWWKKYGGMFDDYFHDVLLTLNNELVFVGTYSIEKFLRNMYLLKTDSSGKEIWSRIYDSTGSGFNIDEIRDKGYLLSGSSELNVDYNGELKYSRRNLGTNGLSDFSHNGFIFFDNMDTNGVNAIKIIRTDSMFNTTTISWIYKSDRLLYGSKIIKSDKSYIIGGESISFQGDEDAYILKIDTSGNLIWDRLIPSRFEFNERIIDISIASDSGFISVGLSSPFSGSSDFLGIKTDRKGNTVPVSVQNNSNYVSKDYVLNQNFPNPFNSTTRFSYSVISDGGFINLSIFNNLGQKVETLVNDFKVRGTYYINYDASKLSSGIFFYTMTIVSRDSKLSKSITKKFILLK